MPPQLSKSRGRHGEALRAPPQQEPQPATTTLSVDEPCHVKGIRRGPVNDDPPVMDMVGGTGDKGRHGERLHGLQEEKH